MGASTRRLLVCLAGAILAGGVAGCAASESANPGSPAQSGSSPTPSSPAGSAGGLRGTAVPRVDCAAPDLPAARASALVPAAPVEVVVCPLAIPSATGRPVTLQPVPADLLAALSLPDTARPKDPSYACPAYADVPRAVFARTADGTWYRLRIPIDGACGHYLAVPLSLLSRYAPTQVAP
jgi:hypothetical protein